MAIIPKGEKIEMHKLVMEAMRKRLFDIATGYSTKSCLKEFEDIILNSKLTVEMRDDIIKYLREFYNYFLGFENTEASREYLLFLIQKLYEE